MKVISKTYLSGKNKGWKTKVMLKQLKEIEQTEIRKRKVRNKKKREVKVSDT